MPPHPDHSDALQGQPTRREVLRRGVALSLSMTAARGLLAAGGAAVLTPTQSSAAQVARPRSKATGKQAILNFGAVQEPSTLDPHLSTSVADTMLKNIYEPLVDTDTDTGRVVPTLAVSWSVARDGLSVIFKLRGGVLFHDGTPFNANAAIVNFKRCIALKSYIPEAFDAIDSLEALDNLTLRVKLKRVINPWVSMLSLNPKMISPTAIEKQTQGGDLAKTWLAQNTVGTGAYMHTRWDRGSNLVWEAFPKYWRGWEGRHVTTVNNRIVLEPGTQRLLLEAGDLDVEMNYTQDALPALRRNPNLNVVGVDLPNLLYIRLNNFTGPTADVRVRKAISYGFDYSAYTKLLGFDRPRADMPIPVQLFGPGYRAVKIPYLTYDPDMGRKLLKEAGHGNGFQMNLFHDPGVPQKAILAEYFQSAMSRLGIKVKIVVEPFVNILARGADQQSQKNWNTAVHTWILYTAPLYPDASSFLLRMYTPYPAAVRNLLGYNSPQVARLTQEAVAQKDFAAATKLYWQANLQIVQDCPDLMLDRSIQFTILRKWVKGHRPHALEPWRWTYWDAWKEM
ncbi:MAG: ABC transporter substrate-binding protein [Armatimonadetes bacterium]|nr:ABC transporter substrate-binding protein [Armatimonadota bacterium]